MNSVYIILDIALAACHLFVRKNSSGHLCGIKMQQEYKNGRKISPLVAYIPLWSIWRTLCTFQWSWQQSCKVAIPIFISIPVLQMGGDGTENSILRKINTEFMFLWETCGLITLKVLVCFLSETNRVMRFKDNFWCGIAGGHSGDTSVLWF